MISKEHIAEWFRGLQDRICQGLEELDGTGRFAEDQWTRPEGGGGRSRVIEGAVIEKGGVNFSAVHGPMPERIHQALGLPSSDFFATGVSIVLHPRTPMVPIIHMNVRYFETQSHSGTESTWWFGGGIDLTPHYIVQEDARRFHLRLKEVCDQHHPEWYSRFKKWADDYFFLKHRNETRGVGGIFFDRLNEAEGKSKAEIFDFVKNVGEAFVPAYAEQVAAGLPKTYGQSEQEWQALRRSRYVEFNLLWDKGTRFGLDTGGRTESILMSMPPLAKWKYNHSPEPGSPEAETQELLRKGIEWV